MPDWHIVKLGEVAAEVTVGHVGPMATEYVTEGVPFLRSQNVVPFGFDLAEVKYINQDFHSRLRKSALRPGDVVTVRTGKPGTTAVVPPDWPQANCADLVITRPGPKLHSRWLCYYMNSAAAGFISAQLVGAVQQHFNVGAAKAMAMPLPTLAEQEAVAEVLGALDDKIAANTSCLGVIDDFASAQLDARLDVEPEWTNLGTVAEVNSATVRPASAGSLKYIDIASVGVGGFDFPVRSPWDAAPSRARRGVRLGDTIWSTVRPNRRSHALVLSDDPELVASTGLAVLTPKEGDFAFVYEVTRLPEFTAFLEGAAEGSAYPAVRADRFADAPIPDLTPAVRSGFERVVAPMRRWGATLAEESRMLAELRDTLLPQLISGRLRVRDAEKQVEAVV